MSNESGGNIILKGIIIALIVYAGYKLFFSKKKVDKKPQYTDPVSEELGVPKTECKNMVRVALVGPGIQPMPFKGAGWCAMGDNLVRTGPRGHAYANKQAEAYAEFKQDEALQDINLSYVQFRLINSTGTKQPVSVLDTTQDTGVFDGTLDNPLPEIPVLSTPSAVTYNSFRANWYAAPAATGYFLDVSTDSGFLTFVMGYNNKDIGNVTLYDITGLSPGQTYYYRLRAYNSVGTSGDSDTGTVTLSTAIYAGTSNSGLILVSSDNGITFSSLGSAGLGNPMCFCRLSNGDVLYGTDIGYVVNLTQGTNVYIDATIIQSMVQNANTGRIFMVTSGGFIYYSDDNGASFNAIADIGNAYSVITYGADEWVAFSVNGIYLNAVIVQAGTFNCAVDVGAGVFYAGTNNGHIWKSNDYGATWSDLGDKTSGSNHSVLVLLTSGRILLTDDTIFYWYTDDGFTTLTNPNVGNNCVSGVMVADNTVLLGGSNGYIYYSDDNGASFAGIAGNPQQGETSINCLLSITN